MQPLNTTHSFLITTWNVNFRSASVLEGFTSLHTVPDIFTLQEVSVKQVDNFGERLSEMGLPFVVYSGSPKSLEKQYGNIIASRWPVELIEDDKLKDCIPWPQLIAQAIIKVGDYPISIITVHIPNGSGNGWSKIDTFRALANIVSSVQSDYCILTGDFNEPQFAFQADRIVTFGQDQLPNGHYTYWNKWSFDGRTGTGEEWDAAVRWFFENQNEHGLRLAFWDEKGLGTMEPTHISRGNPRWFDHIFISEYLSVQSCSYLHETRLGGFSDHSALIAQLAIVQKK